MSEPVRLDPFRLHDVERMAKLEAENAKLETAIEHWKEEEIWWKKREAELLADSKRLDKLQRDHGWQLRTTFEEIWIVHAKGQELMFRDLREAIDELEEQDHE